MAGIALGLTDTLIPGEDKWLNNGVLGLMCLTLLVGIVYLFRLWVKGNQTRDTEQEAHKKEIVALQEAHKTELNELQDKHKEEMKALLYELVEAAKEQSSEYLTVADRVTMVLESLERRFPGERLLPPSDRRR